VPLEGQLPQAGGQHDTNADADRCFRAFCPRNWRPHSLEGTDDYGLDYNIQTTPQGSATDMFRVQLKGTVSPSRTADGSFISIQLKASTVRYYSRLVEPVLLVVCDLSGDPADPLKGELYYVWLRDELRRVTVDRNQRYVTLRVPIANRLKGADLSRDIDQQNELSRAGHALDLRVAETHPGMDTEGRLAVVQGIAEGVVARSPTFIDALAAPAEEHWVNPPQGSLPWQLQQAKARLQVGAVDQAEIDLDAAAQRLDGATPMERAEYFFLRGKWLTATGKDADASASFAAANETSAKGKYLAAWAEAEIRTRYTARGPACYPDLLEKLTGDDPFVLSARSRVLAAEGRFEESNAIADLIPGPERHAAKALVATMDGKPQDAASECEFGLADPNLSENSRQMLLLLRARAKFTIAQESVGDSELEGGSGDEVLPPSGPAGIDPQKVKDAWTAIEPVIECLRASGWSSNVEYLADIWAATASMLGKQKVALPALTEAAKARPHLENVQAALESLAAQVGDFGTALEANSRLPRSTASTLRRTLLLHEAQRHRECVRHFEFNFSTLERKHKLFGPAATVAAISAHKMVRPELVERWSQELESRDDLKEHAALLHYWLAVEQSPLAQRTALDALLARYEELGEPFMAAVALLQELNPTDPEQAPALIRVAQRVRQKVEPSPAMATHIAMALVTEKRWPDLLQFCDEFKARLDAAPRMVAFEALALDRVGRTAEARQLLEQMIAGGIADSLALNTYVIIMIRCGFVQEALDAAEKIMETADSKRQRMDCIRLLFNLIQYSDPSSSRLLALALEMGAMADPASEVEEGIYLLMFITATIPESNKPTPKDVATFHQRSEAFFTNYPDSKIVGRVQWRDDAPPEEMLAQLRKVAGVTEDQEAAQKRLESQLRSGVSAAPFAWRPRLILSSIQDVVHLWEIAKVSGADDRQYHLTMLTDANWNPPPASTLRERTPLLDMTALLVLYDLGLIDAAVQFFGRIAIAKSTLETLADWVNPFSGSPMRSKCVALQDALKPHLSSILQPSVASLPEDDEEALDEQDLDVDEIRRRALGRENQEIARLCRERASEFRLYSDDLAYRIVCGGDNPDGFCTLDLLGALEELRALSRAQVAEKVAQLCGWRVGLVVRFEELASLLPPELNTARSVRDGVAVLDKSPAFTATVSALWDFRGKFAGTLHHAAAVVRRLCDETKLPELAIAALTAQWQVKAGLKADAVPAASLAPLLILQAAAPHLLQPTSAKKLWSIYKALLEYRHGDHMDEQKEREGIRKLGSFCASLQASQPPAGEVAFQGLRSGLTSGTSDDADFERAYAIELTRLRTRSPGS
jgi:hypothetical protein